MKFSRTIVKNYIDSIKIFNENGELKTEPLQQETILTTKELSMVEANKIMKKLYPDENIMVMKIYSHAEKREMDIKTFIKNSTVVPEREDNNENNENNN